MGVMPPPRPYFPQPSRTGKLLAQRSFNMRIDKNALDCSKSGGGLQQVDLTRGPHLRIEALTIGSQHRWGADRFVGRGGERFSMLCQPEPNIDIQTGLMAPVSARNGTTSGLAQVADIEHTPFFFGDL